MWNRKYRIYFRVYLFNCEMWFCKFFCTNYAKYCLPLKITRKSRMTVNNLSFEYFMKCVIYYAALYLNSKTYYV